MYEPLRITAFPRCGIVTDGTLPLDGILLYYAMREAYGEQDTTASGQVLQRLVDLPLAKRGTDPHWYYACSFAQWGNYTEGGDYWVKRFRNNHEELIDFGGKRGKVIIEQGQYKNYRMPVFYRHALRIEWYAVGDKNTIMRLLAPCTHIGKKTSQGWGRVDWRIEECESDWSEWGAEGQQMRPLPAKAGILTGIRPPYWLPVHQTLCRM